MSATAETIALLKSIDASLQHLVSLAESRKPQSVDLDSEHGNPEVKAKDPRDWSGPSMFGKRFSECPATYLDVLADRYDHFASKETDEKKRKYNLLDAARARGWAARVRAGIAGNRTLPEPAGFPSDMVKDDEISF